MARIGELLVATGLLTPEQVELALRAQVVWGGRFGTNLVELGYIGLDELSTQLGRQHTLPAALARHFDRADRELQGRISSAFAERFSIVPLLRIGDERKVAIAAIDPLDPASLEIVAAELALDPDRLVVSVAAELRIRYHLERIYQIARDARFLRSKGQTVTSFPELGEVPVPIDSEDELTTPVSVDAVPETITPSEPGSPEIADSLAALIDQATALGRPPSDPGGRERRTYVRTLGDMVDAGVPTGLDAKALGRIAIRRVVVGVPADPEPAAIATFAAATRAIRRGSNRDRVAELVIDTIDQFAPICEAAILLIIRGPVAIGWKWFNRSGATPPELAVPMDQPGLVPTVVERNITARCAGEDLGAIDLLLLHALGKPDGDLVVVPIAIAGRVMCLIATATEPDAPVAAVEAIATAAGTAFARLIRNASR